MDETSLLGDALKQQSLEKGNNWLNKIKQELERLGMGDIWINGEENNRNVWREVSKRRVDIERQNMEASMWEKKDLWYITVNLRVVGKRNYTQRYVPKRLEEV
jgi:DNA repair ATPase RecN